MLALALKGGILAAIVTLITAKPDLFVSYMRTLTMVGCTILVILYVGGLKQGIRFAGILFVSYIIIVAMLGSPVQGAAPETSGFILPVSGPVSSPFGPRSSGFHHGIDFAVNEGTKVLSSKAGTVGFAGYNGNIVGNVVEVDHPDGTQTMYAHNSRVLVIIGQPVKQGEVIALSGNTGRSTGPHVHFEIRFDRGTRSVDPAPYLGL